MEKSIVYVSSPDLVRLSSLLPKIQDRAALVDELVRAYGMDGKMDIVEPTPVCG